MSAGNVELVRRIYAEGSIDSDPEALVSLCDLKGALRAAGYPLQKDSPPR